MKTDQTQLPPNWVFAELSDVSEIISGYGFPESLQGQTEGEIPFYKVGDISEAWKRGAIQLSTANHYVTQKVADSLNAKLLPPSTTVFAKIGAAIALNRRAMLSVPSLVDNNVMGLRPIRVALNPAYLFYFTCTLRLNEISQATTVPSIRKSDVERIRLPLPPVREQERIVSEIEKQFTRLDAAVAAIKRVQINLKRYRAAVLKAACEGRLVPTEAELARREGRSYEPASVLLEHILSNRRSHWEANGLSKLKTSGEPPKDLGWKQKYKVPCAPASGSAPVTPEGWAVGSLEQLTSAVRVICYGILMPKEDLPDGVPYVRVLDLRGDKIDIENLKRTSSAIAQAYARASLKGGDVLLAIRGSYGRVAEVPFELEGGNITQDTARLEVSELVDHRYIATCLRSPVAQSYFKRVARGVAVKGVNIADVRLCPIPIPPYPEQGRIVVEVERRLSIIDELVTQIDADSKRAARLRQSILKGAFEGMLVPQDPTDEHASVLLERVRETRNAVHKRVTIAPRGRRKQGATHVS